VDWIVSYTIDRDDRIHSVSDAWVAFALANNGEHLLPPAILGRELWQMVSDLTTRHVYQVLLRNVRAGTGAVGFQFRCDSPAERRLLSMHMTLRSDDQVEFETALVRDQPRVPLPMLDPSVPRSGELLRICAWCMRVPVSEGRWAELEDAIREMRLFERPMPPPLTHGMCPRCHDNVMGLFDSGPGNSAPVVFGSLP
jgi:hypothetical protein